MSLREPGRLFLVHTQTEDSSIRSMHPFPTVDELLSSQSKGLPVEPTIALVCVLATMIAGVAKPAPIVGLSVGPAVADLGGARVLDEPKIEAGIHARTSLVPEIGVSIRTGLLYRTLGVFVPSGFYSEEYQRSGYLSVPMEIEFCRSERETSPLFGVGLSFDTLLHARTRPFGMNARPETDIFNEYRRVQWSAVASLGAQFGKSWSVRLRGSYGLTDYWREDYGSMRNKSIALEVGKWLPSGS